mgnify:CR=1 FL=1
MIRFACSSCRIGVKAPERKAGRWSVCPRCGTTLQVPKSFDYRTLPPPIRNLDVELISEPPELDMVCETGDPVPFPLLTILAWLCPMSLVTFLFLDFASGYVYWKLPWVFRYRMHFGVETLPDHVGLLGIIAYGAGFLGFLITITTFVAGVVKNHKLAIVLSSVTFVLSFLLVPIVAGAAWACRTGKVFEYPF